MSYPAVELPGDFGLISLIGALREDCRFEVATNTGGERGFTLYCDRWLNALFAVYGRDKAAPFLLHATMLVRRHNEYTLREVNNNCGAYGVLAVAAGKSIQVVEAAHALGGEDALRALIPTEWGGNPS